MGNILPLQVHTFCDREPVENAGGVRRERFPTDRPHFRLATRVPKVANVPATTTVVATVAGSVPERERIILPKKCTSSKAEKYGCGVALADDSSAVQLDLDTEEFDIGPKVIAEISRETRSGEDQQNY
jgi:hypothetical protein